MIKILNLKKGGTAFIHPFGIGEEEGYDISGGGFSDVFDMPDYQKDLVAGFLGTSEKLPPGKQKP
jgi:tripeptidyl-peptidase-1